MIIRETDLIPALEPFKGFVTSAVIFALQDSGIDQDLATGATVDDLVHERNLDRARLVALIDYLVAAGLADRHERSAVVTLTVAGQQLAEVKPWYEMMIGGYGAAFLALSGSLRAGSPPAPREGRYVGAGSCGISMHDSIPLLRKLLSRADRDYQRLVDLGCGTGVYLTELCGDYPRLTAVGIEPDEESVRTARHWVSSQSVADRVSVVQADALEWLAELRQTADRPDLAVLAFVMHEVLGQDGEDGVRRLLSALFEAAPTIDLVVIEIEDGGSDALRMQHPLAQNYYNAYFLMHPFTRQRLMPRSWWENLFRESGLTIAAADTTDPAMDSTGFEVGWLLRQRTEPAPSLV